MLVDREWLSSLRGAWDRIVAGRDLATVRELQQEGLATGDIPANLFIFFNVLP